MPQYWTSIARWAFTAVAGWLIARGYFTEAESETAIGALLVLLPLLWAVISKHSTRQTIKDVALTGQLPNGKGPPLAALLLPLVAVTLIAAPMLTACATSANWSQAEINRRLDHAQTVLELGKAGVATATSTGLLSGERAAQADRYLADAQLALDAARAASILGQTGTVQERIGAVTQLAFKLAALLAQARAEHAALEAGAQRLAVMNA